MRLEFDRELLEEVVARDLRALEGTREEATYRSAANRLYADRDEARREDGFAALNLEVLRRRGHDAVVVAALLRAPAVAAALERAVVLKAPQRRDEDVDLVPGATRTLRLRLLPERFADAAALSAYLGRQLVYVSDLLDPSFGYERTERLAANPAEDALFRDRYRLFWELTVLGRLPQDEAAREEPRLRAELAALYSRVPAEGRERIFERLVRGPRPTHHELLAAARDTARLLALAGVAPSPEALGPQAGHPCPLCRFPTHAWRRTGPSGSRAREALMRDFPHWRPEHGVCERCSDLYELRHPEPVAI